MKRTMTSAMAATAILALLLPGCRSTEHGGAAEVESALAGLIAADNEGDLDRVVSHYAADAVLMPPSGPAVTGRDRIRERYAAGFERFRLDVAIDFAETRAAGDLAFSRGLTHGRFVWRDGRPPSPFCDKYLAILRRDEDGWRIATLMWSPSETRESRSDRKE